MFTGPEGEARQHRRIPQLRLSRATNIMPRAWRLSLSTSQRSQIHTFTLVSACLLSLLSLSVMAYSRVVLVVAD